MLKLETKPQPSNVSYVSRPELESTHQLFVLVPFTEADSTMLTRRVWELANAGEFHVQFIGLCSDAGNELATRRALVSMSSMMNFGNVTSDMEVIIGKNWVDNLKLRMHPGDMVVYWDAQPAGSLRRSLGQLLHAKLNVSLYIISDKSTSQEASSSWGSQVAVWIGFIIIMFGFLFLQIKIYQLASSLTTVLALLSTVVEFWLIGVWHNRFK